MNDYDSIWTSFQELRCYRFVTNVLTIPTLEGSNEAYF
jgi:hypothetical protein